MLQGNKREEKEGKAGSSLNVLDTLSRPVHRAWPWTPGPSSGHLQAAAYIHWPPAQQQCGCGALQGTRRRGAFPGLLWPFLGGTLNLWCPGSRLLSWDERVNPSA